MRKKSQVKFGETIGIIIIVYIIVVVGFVWYNQINTKNVTEIYEKDQRDRAFEKYHYIVNLHLIHNSERGDLDEDFNIDAIRALEQYSQTEEGFEYMRRSLGDSIVTISILLDSLDDDGNPTFIPGPPIVVYSNVPNLADQSLEYNEESFRTIIPVIDETNRRTDMAFLELTNYIPAK